MTNFCDLPVELQNLIARYLDDDKLSELKLLNTFFFNFWMDREWRDLHISTRNPSLSLFKLQRVTDPFILRRLKSLTITLTLLPIEGTIQPSTFEADKNLVLSSLPFLPNIIFLRIILSVNGILLFPSAMSKVESLFARTVRELALTGDVELLKSLACKPSINWRGWNDRPFANLTTLHLKLQTVPRLGANPNAQADFALALASFLHSVSPTLQLLHITYMSQHKLDLSPVFNDLSKSNSAESVITIPNFEALELCLDWTTFFPSLPSVHHFLLTYRDILRHLTLMFEGSVQDQLLGPWLANLANNCRFSLLETLVIYPTQSQTGLSATLTLIKRSAPSLSSLTICDRYLIPKEAYQVIDALSESDQVEVPTNMGLASLSLNITDLSVPILEYVARKIPNLANLTLNIRPVGIPVQHEFYDLLSQRSYNHDNVSVTNDPLHTWKLTNLTISIPGKKHPKLLSAIRSAVPSLDKALGTE